MLLYVWDFHGVLEKDNEIALAEQVNHILEKYGFGARISPSQALSLSGRHYRQVFMDLCPGIGSGQAREMGDYAISTGIEFAKKFVKPREHARDVLLKIREQGNRNIVASNTAPASLEEYVKMVGLEGCFNALLPVETSQVKPESFSILDYKFRSIEKFIRGQEFSGIKCIGDSERDIELGLRLNAETFLFSPTRARPETKASRVISDLREVL